MNSRFKKYIKALQDGAETAAVLDELHKSFATLTQEEQKYANIFLHDVQNGDVVVDEGRTLRDYITEYMTSAQNDQIHRFATAIGVDETMLRSFMQSKITEANINEFGKFDTLKATVDMEKALYAWQYVGVMQGYNFWIGFTYWYHLIDVYKRQIVYSSLI